MIAASDFLKKQLSFPRVRETQLLHEDSLRALLYESGLSYPTEKLYLRAFKLEQMLEVWGADDDSFHLIKTHAFTSSSGNPGPKQREGDRQIPEGFYHITHFNPESRYHLSLRLNYPNRADAARNKKETHPGGDIYIHGGVETVGCIPIGDDNIAELYWLCVQSYTINPCIPVHIFPCVMEAKTLSGMYRQHPEYIDFWNSMEPMYHYFQKHKTLTDLMGCDEFGNYTPGFS